MSRLAANAAWWELVCSPAVAHLVKRPFLRWRRLNLERSGARATEALRDLRHAGAYESIGRYMKVVSTLAEHITALNQAQDELVLSLAYGPRVSQLNYGHSRSLVDYANQETLLSRLAEHALSGDLSQIDLLVVSVTSPEELLSALVVVRQLRRHHPRMHACLADHGYENFSLAPHLGKLRCAGTLDSIFDSIVESKDDRDWILPRLADEVSSGTARRGFLRRRDFPKTGTTLFGMGAMYLPPPSVPTFAPQQVFCTRISARRCYWSRCAFCVQNNKYDTPETPSLAELPAVLDRLAALSRAGYRNLLLADEALSPSLLDRLSRGLIERQIEISWCCRAKLELAFEPALFRLMRQAGCCEVLFGLESISPRVLKRMDKFVEGLTRDRIKQILQDAGAAGIGVHVNLIAGFPGDTPAEAAASVEFLVEALASLSHATFILNRFELFPDTPVMKNPAYGVEPIETDADMPFSYSYRLRPDLLANSREIDRLLPALRRQLHNGLGWDRLGDGRGAEAAQWLYFATGHGALFKSQPDSIFCSPLRYPAVVRRGADSSIAHPRYLRWAPIENGELDSCR
jgi:hypothetical protein